MWGATHINVIKNDLDVNLVLFNDIFVNSPSSMSVFLVLLASMRLTRLTRYVNLLLRKIFAGDPFNLYFAILCRKIFKRKIMPSSESYLNYVLDLLKNPDNVTYKKMMGEYLLYKDAVLFGGIYDDRFLIKKTNALKNYGLKEENPYDGAKPMYLIDTEDADLINDLIEKTIKELK